MGGGALKKGQTLIEFALVLPLLLLLVMNVVNFGAFLYAGITVANASRAGAQFMIMGSSWVGGPDNPPYADIQQVVENDLFALPNRASAQITVCRNYPSPAPDVCEGPSPATAPPPDPESDLYVSGSVDVTYTYQPVIPFWDFPGLGIHLTLPSTTIHRRALMRMVL